MEKVITVGLQTSTLNSKLVEESMDELGRLTDTAGGVVVHSIIQNAIVLIRQLSSARESV